MARFREEKERSTGFSEFPNSSENWDFHLDVKKRDCRGPSPEIFIVEERG